MVKLNNFNNNCLFKPIGSIMQLNGNSTLYYYYRHIRCIYVIMEHYMYVYYNEQLTVKH